MAKLEGHNEFYGDPEEAGKMNEYQNQLQNAKLPSRRRMHEAQDLQQRRMHQTQD